MSRYFYNFKGPEDEMFHLKPMFKRNSCIQVSLLKVGRDIFRSSNTLKLGKYLDASHTICFELEKSSKVSNK